MPTDIKVAFSDAARSVPTPDGTRWAAQFAHGTLAVEIYAPRGTDPQQPHTRDEAYIVARGSGEFVHGNERVKFASGDFLFAAAGVPHRFEHFSADFYTWVLFYGPEGGEPRIR
ncbi:MAG: cupin domain-containing protein [Candidatus Koribacter versatilis]|uniref:Cupin domain-containing protein n=1 Tax=Candidatus Korobacter versatilis TaxID=658062 RepID=A0A932A7L1_9BACT|nr:cupin domain-containing protein [Candidatus Koribacter versatilis]